MKTNINDIVERDWNDEEMDAVEAAMERRAAAREVAVLLVKVLGGLLLVIGLLTVARAALSGDRVAAARQEGWRLAEAEIEAAGGERAWVQKVVNEYCDEHGLTRAY